MLNQYKPVVLVIFDGWGVAPASEGNAITRAKTPHFLEYLKNYPAMTLHASGNEVGLLFGEIGNSEVGHLNIGAGRVYYQSCPRINQAIADQSFFANPSFVKAVEHAKKNKSNMHLIGMVSNGNVHASTEHLVALLELCKRNKVTSNVYVHVILDGRDCHYNSGKQFVENLRAKMKELKVGEIASVSGRFFAMDRDNRWSRVEQAYNAMAIGKSDSSYDDAITAIDASYAEKVYDEEFVPTVITKKGQPVGIIKEHDAVIFSNFRSDRAREITKAFVLPGFDKFKRDYIKDLFFVTMVEYEKDLPVSVAYEPIVVDHCLAQVVSEHKLKQIHLAETEKYGHVTFFLNGTLEQAFAGEDRVLVPSPKVANYAETPEMSAFELTKEVVKVIDKKQHDLIVVNYANADMVGHTGNVDATIKACEAVDKCLGDVVEHTLSAGGVVAITADHGNAEEVINLQTGEIDKEHSTNPVPFIVVGKDFLGQAGPDGDPPEGDLSLLPPVGVLADVAPTILKLMGVDVPPQMSGTPLI